MNSEIISELAKKMPLKTESRQGPTAKLKPDTWRALRYLSIRLSIELGQPMTIDDVIRWLIEQTYKCGKLPT